MSSDDMYRSVMMADPPAVETPLAAATRDFVIGAVWNRPGLSVRDRRFVTLSCVCAADAVASIDAHIYAALKSGDISIDEMNEFTLQFAVYCGWPKGSQVEMSIRAQWHRIHAEQGIATPPFAQRFVEDLGRADLHERIAEGARSFEEINLVPAPPQDSPYYFAGILNFVFGHLWQRPGLTRRERRLITVPCVGVSDAASPIYSHVTSALTSGDITYDEMHELILQFSAYSGVAKAQVLADVAVAWKQRQT
jgi:4-carboxymuconolactone decarboxylase